MMVMPLAMPVPMSMTMSATAAIFIMAFSAISKQIAMLIRIALYVKIDRIGEIFDRTKLIDRDVSCRSIDHCWNAVNDISTRVLDRCWLCDREFRIGLAKDLPIAQIAIIRTIHLANALRLYNGPLVSLSGDHRAHADALSSWMVLPIVSEYVSTSAMKGTLFCVCDLIVQPMRLQSDSFEFHI